MLPFDFLSLIEKTERIIFNRIFTLFYHLAAVKAFPTLKVYEVVEERL